MKRAAFIAAIAIALASLAFGQSKQGEATPNKEEQALIQFDENWAAAIVRADADALDRILGEDFIATDANGVVKNKAQFIGDIKSGAVSTASSTTHSYRVKIYGETAVVAHGATVKRQVAGKDVSGEQRSTHVFVRRNGQWQVVAHHVTRVAQP